MKFSIIQNNVAFFQEIYYFPKKCKITIIVELSSVMQNFSKKCVIFNLLKLSGVIYHFLKITQNWNLDNFVKILGKKLSKIVQNFLRKCRIVQNWNLDNGTTSTCELICWFIGNWTSYFIYNTI